MTILLLKSTARVLHRVCKAGQPVVSTGPYKTLRYCSAGRNHIYFLQIKRANKLAGSVLLPLRVILIHRTDIWGTFWGNDVGDTYKTPSSQGMLRISVQKERGLFFSLTLLVQINGSAIWCSRADCAQASRKWARDWRRQNEPPTFLLSCLVGKKWSKQSTCLSRGILQRL